MAVHIPDSVATIDPSAFSGCEEVVIYGKRGSAVEAYANGHDNCTFAEE